MLTTPLPSRAERLGQARDLHGRGRIGEAEAIYRILVDHDADDAEALHLLGVARHQCGAPAEAAAMIRRALALQPDLVAGWQNLILPLIDLGRFDEAVAAGEEAVRRAPERAGARGNAILALIKAGRHAEAALVAEEGLALDPHVAALWTQLGHIRLEQKHHRLGEQLLRRALALDPNHLEAHYNLGVALQAQRREVEAIAPFEAALGLDAGHRGARLNLGVALRSIGRVAEALAVWRASPVPEADWADLAYDIGCGHLLAGDWQAGWPGWERRMETIQPVLLSYRGAAPRWSGEPAPEATLLIHHEQGLGDTVQSARFVAAAAESVGRAVLVCQPALKVLLSSLAPVAEGRVELLAEGEPLPPHDLMVPLMSLPAVLEVTRENVVRRPYLSAGGERTARWAEHFRSAGIGQRDGRRTLRVGLVWQGNPNAPVEKGRSIPLADLVPLGAVPNVDLVSLQKGFGADQPDPPGLRLHRLGEAFDSGPDAFLDTVAVAGLLDLVITSDTSVAHVLGALGRPVWLLLKDVPDWRWGLSGRLTPWYPSMQVFRQAHAGDWTGVAREVAAGLGLLAGLLDHPAPVAPERLNEVFRAALARHEVGRHGEALPDYRALIATRPLDGRLFNVFGMATMEAGRRSPAALKAALPLVLRAVALAPCEPDFLSNLAILLDKLGARADARLALQHALSLDPAHLPAQLTLATIEAAAGAMDAALARVRRAIARAPRAAAGYSSYAALATQAGRTEEAAHALRRAVDLDPANARLLVQFGAALMAAGDADGAARAWERALAVDPANADALGNLGVHERSHGDTGIAEWLHAEAIRHDPSHAEAWSNRGIAALDGGRVEPAVAAFREAVRLKPDYADARMALGMALIGQGHWAEGLAEYEWRLKSTRLGLGQDMPRLPRWRGGDPRGKSFLALCEQGFGDAIQFVRYVKLLKAAGAAKVFVGCRAKLAALMLAAEGVDGVVTEGGKVPPLDYCTHLMSLPLRFGTVVETIPGTAPYITAEAARVERWAAHLAARPGFRIGLIWQGNPDPQVDKGRSMPLNALAPLARIPGVRLIALQKGFGAEQMAEADFPVEDLGASFDSGPDAFLDTAAMIRNLDLVVSTDTAVAHLAGAVGAPVWLFLKAQAEWRWLESRADTPWYPTMRLFRQYPGDGGDSAWAGAIGRLAGEVGRLVAGDRARLHDRAEVGPRPRPPQRLTPAQAFAHGLKAHQAGDLAAAAGFYGQVLVEDPDHAEALHMLGAMALQAANWPRALLFLEAARARGLATTEFRTNLAVALRNLGRGGAAEVEARSVVAEKPSAEACLALGNILRDREASEDAAAVLRQAVVLGPASAKARRGLANALKDLGQMPDALAEFDRAVKLTPDDAELRLDRAHALLYSGAFAAGFAEYEWRHKASEMMPRVFAAPRWTGRRFDGRTLLVHGEQGLGDHIQFARFVARAAAFGGRVLLEVRRPLFGLMRSLDLPWDRVEIVEQGLDLPDFDLEVPLLSLPHVLKVEAKTFAATVPYLSAEPERMARWRGQVDPGRLSVGLIWQGNPKARADKGRSPSLAALAPLFDLPGVQFVALQKEHGLEQLADPAFVTIERPGAGFDEGPDAFLDTAALMASLDCVVTSDTAAAHLAGALGRPVLTMLKAVPDWRWTHRRTDSVWYPTMEVFRQPAPGNWASVAVAVRAALAVQVERR